MAWTEALATPHFDRMKQSYDDWGELEYSLTLKIGRLLRRKW